MTDERTSSYSKKAGEGVLLVRRYVGRVARAPLHAKLALVYTLVITLFVVGAGLTYGWFTTSWIRSYTIAEAQESAETLGVTLADAVLLENQGALRARAEASAAVIELMHLQQLERTREQMSKGGAALESVQQQAIDFLSVQQIGQDGYFFVFDSAGDIAYHPYEEVRTANQADTPVVQRIREQGHGYIRYYWQNPSDSTPKDKFGYITYFEPWDWFVVATDYAAGFLDRMPGSTLQSLLDGYQQKSILSAVVRSASGGLIGASSGWAETAGDISSAGIWAGGAVPTARAEPLDQYRILALAPLAGFDAEVGVLFSGSRLRDLRTSYTRVAAVSLVLAIVAIYGASRAAGHFIARPVRQLSDRLNRRLGLRPGGPAVPVASRGSDDLRALLLQQLRTLVRLDYEVKGRRAAEREAMLAESAFTHTSEGIIVTDADGTVIRVNPAFEMMTGYSASELIGHSPRVLKSGRHDERFYRRMWADLRDSGAWVGEVWNRRKNGEEYPQLLSIRAVRADENGGASTYVAVCHDISDRKAAEERLHHLATHDALTGLPNRAYLNDVLDYTVRQARRRRSVIAVLFLDVDDFKDVNDSYGHEAGDQLLSWIARRLEFQLRSEDIVVRFGGDEFVILLPGIDDAEYASVVARRVLAAVREPYMIANQKFRPSVSIGIAIYPEAGREASDLLRDADAAMYAAKRQGRNTYRFHDPRMNENAHRRLAMQGSVAGALDRGEFLVVYQPILSLRSKTIAGVEALVRWKRDGEVVLPGEFMPFLENSSMLERLDLWVLDQVCMAMASVAVRPEPFYVSVNAGAYSLIQDDYVHRVTEVVARHGVSPSRIAIEVTESAAIRNFDRARATLGELSAAGFSLALDDFGAGHSSIRYLREFGVDSVKLDRAYLSNVERSGSARSLVGGFTQLAHGMQLKAIIEGVETRGQLDFVRKIGCDFAQGFLIGRPTDLTSALGGSAGEKGDH